MSLEKENIDKGNVPSHIAVIMDGNGRWARQKGAERIFGHQNAVKSVKEITEGCVELGIPYLTLYAFSTENWERPKEEVDALMHLLVATLQEELDELIKNGVKLQVIGEMENLPIECQEKLEESSNRTKENERLLLTLALSYSGKWDITNAIKNIVKDVVSGELNSSEINEKLVSSYLSTKDIPDPALMIRTGGEMRISNFLLWQLAYSELYITDTMWPDFRKKHLREAILSFQKRERRFGRISDQLNLKA
ncbi:MAG: isoprenyl transferase [Cyclobacteriaceae bacterium]|nr:isoprenyl transferase [Cyclobacteriaceae bacterium]